MQDKLFKVRTMAWYGDEEIELNFPACWEVVNCKMAGHDTPALTDDQIEAAFAHPIGTERVRELARGKREAVILFDDMRRPTPVGEIARFVLNELKDAGMKDNQIRFMLSRANHENMDNEDFLKKLGPESAVYWYRSWPEVLAQLNAAHGEGTRVALYPCAPIQYPESEEKSQPG